MLKGGALSPKGKPRSCYQNPGVLECNSRSGERERTSKNQFESFEPVVAILTKPRSKPVSRGVYIHRTQKSLVRSPPLPAPGGGSFLRSAPVVHHLLEDWPTPDRRFGMVYFVN